MPLPAMSGAEPCTGSNSRRKVALGIDVGRRRDADRAADRGPEIGQDVAEQIRADDDVEPVGMLHEMRGQDVDVVLVGADVRILRRHRAKALVPVRHRDRDAVRLGRRGDVLRRAASAPARTRTCRMRSTPLRVNIDLLEHDLALGALEHAAADRRVLAFGVLAHDDEVDVAGLAVRRAATECPASAGTAAGSRTGRSGGATGSASPRARRDRAPSPASRPRRRRSRRGRGSARTSPRASSGRACA